MWPRPRANMRPPPPPFLTGAGYGGQRPPFNQNPGQRMPGQAMQPNQGAGETMAQDPMEAQKITNLQMQAQHWKQSKEQWEHQQEMQQKMDYAKQCTPAQLDAILQEEADFDKQYSDWKKQFLDWQEQNKNHPNQDQYRQYAQTWKDYEVQMEQKKADITARREKLQEALRLKNQLMAQPMPPGPRMQPPPMGHNYGPMNQPPMMAPRNMGPRSFPPNQGNFPPNQGNFPPNQGNYPPTQGTFPPIQGNYGQPNQGNYGPPNQGAFPPNQGNFGPPNQGNFGPNQGNFGPNQGQFRPNRGNFGPNQGIRPPNQGNFGPKPAYRPPAPVKYAVNHSNYGPGINQGNVGPRNFAPNQGSFGPGARPFGPNQGSFPPNQGPPGQAAMDPPPQDEPMMEIDEEPAVPGEAEVAPEAVPEDELPPGTEPEPCAPGTGPETEEGAPAQTEAVEMETEAAEEEDGLAAAIMASMEGEEETGNEPNEQRERIEADSWSTDVAEKVKKEDEKIITEAMKKNLELSAKSQEKYVTKFEQHLAERDKKLAFRQAAETMRMIQEQQERIEQIKQLAKLQKMAEQEKEEERKKEEEEKQRAEKRKADIEKKLAEKKSSQLQQQIEKALDRASGKPAEEKKEEKKIQIKVSLLKDQEKEEEEEKAGEDGKEVKAKVDEKKPVRSYRRRSIERSRSRSLSRPRSPRRRRSRSYSRGRRSRSRSRSRRSRSRSRGRRSRSRSRSRRSRSRSRGRGRRSRSPRGRRRRSRSREKEKVDIFGRSLDIRRPYDEEKRRADEEKRARDRPSSPSRSQSRTRTDDPARTRAGQDGTSSRVNGAKTSLVPYDDEEEDRLRQDPSYGPPRDLYRDDPYRAARDSRDLYRSDPYRYERREEPAPHRGDAYRHLYERPPPPPFPDLPRIPLYDRPPIDDTVRRLLYGKGMVYELYPEQKYNRQYSLFGDDEDEQAAFDYCHGSGKVPDNPYSDPDGSPVDYMTRRSSLTETGRSGMRDSPSDYPSGPPAPRSSAGYDYDMFMGRDDRPRDPLSRVRDQDRYSSRSPQPVGPPVPVPAPSPVAAPPEEEVNEDVSIDDLLKMPGRARRPPRIVIIVRGPPGAGKTYVSKLIRDRESACGGTTPRMLCLDDYFMVETQKMVKDQETGRMTLRQVMEYEYERIMENAYRVSMLKTFKKTVDDGFFPFIIVDAINNKIKHFEEFWSYANSKNFQVYVAELEAETSVCIQRNIHDRSAKEIQDLQVDFDYVRLWLDGFIDNDEVKQSILSLDVLKYLMGVVSLLKRQPARNTGKKDDNKGVEYYTSQTSADQRAPSSGDGSPHSSQGSPTLSSARHVEVTLTGLGGDSDIDSLTHYVTNADDWLALRVNGGSRNWKISTCFNP